MKRERAKELADVLASYANGADLQYEAHNEWVDMKDGDAIVFCIEHGREMRVKQKYNEIFKLCNADKLDELQKLIEENLK